MTDLRPRDFLFREADPQNRPTVWMHNPDDPDHPVALLRDIDIPAEGRDALWEILEEVLSSFDDRAPAGDGWNPLRVDDAGNCWEWEYRDGRGTRIIVGPAEHAYILGLQKPLWRTPMAHVSAAAATGHQDYCVCADCETARARYEAEDAT